MLTAVAAQIGTSAAICTAAGRPVLAGPLDAYETIWGAGAVFGLAALLIEVFRRRLAQQESRAVVAYANAWQSLRGEWPPSRAASATLVFITAPLALSAFSSAKQAIPVLHPFTWDRSIASAGAALSGGKHLWRILQPVLGHPSITVGLDWFYHRVWTALLLAMFVIATLSRPSRQQQRFLVAFVLMWLVVGNLFALWLASAGPAYYDAVTPGPADPFAGLFHYLRAVNANTPLLSYRGEQVLWSAYERRLGGFGFGVSAMPSVHVASAALVALYGFGRSRGLGILLTVVAVFTFVSSVALGWHYAMDGYVGATLAAGIWWIAGKLTRSTPA